MLLFNHSEVDFEVKAGDRVAQLVLERVSSVSAWVNWSRSSIAASWQGTAKQ